MYIYLSGFKVRSEPLLYLQIHNFVHGYIDLKAQNTLAELHRDKNREKE